MLSYAHNKMHRHVKLVLCHLLFCMFFLSALDVESDLCADIHNESTGFNYIESLDLNSDNIINNEDVAIIFIKTNSSIKNCSRKSFSSRKNLLNSMISLKWISSNIFTFSGVYSFKTIIPSRHMLICYIHNQDGLKPLSLCTYNI